MRIAALQMRAVASDVEANLARIASAARDAAAQGADLLVTPELSVTGYGAGDDFTALASPADGWVGERLGAIARDNGLAILAGFAERAGTEIFNSVLLTDGKGLGAVYRKSHLYANYEHRHFFGEPPASVMVAFSELKLGMLICYDVEFPENVRRLAKAGVDMILVATALPRGGSATFVADHVIRVRAFENQIFIVYADHCGEDGRFAYAGLSQIAAPDGSLLALAGPDDEALLIADIKPQDFARSRAENAYLADLPGSAARKMA